MAVKPIIQNSTLTDENGVAALDVATGGAVNFRAPQNNYYGGTDVEFVKRTGAGGFNFYAHNGTAYFSAMSCTSAGAWTLGAGASDALNHEIKGRLRPFADNTYNFGDASHRWIAVYAVNGTIQTASDARLKKNIQPLGLTLDKVLQLKPSTWQAKFDDYVLATSGFVAQELQQVFPELVKETTDSVHDVENVLNVSVGGPETIAILVKAIQELSAKVDSLQSELNTLKGQ